MNSMSRMLCAFVILVAIPIAIAMAPPDDSPLTEEGLTRLVVTLKIKPEAVAGMVRARGVGFEANVDTLARLKKAGVPDVVLAAVNEKAQKPTGKPADPAVTFEQVAEMLKLGVAEADIRDAIKGTVFTLSKAQADELKALGGSDPLIKDLGSAKTIDPARELANLALLIDCSGSMSEQTSQGSTKMDAAKRAAAELIRKVPAGMHLALIIYGHDQALRCEAVKVARPLGPLDEAGRSELIAMVDALQPAGSTPIDLALVTAGKELAKAQGPGGVVLISDGKEMCGGNPAAAAATLAKALKLGFGVQVVGFGVKADEKAALDEIARAGEGSYFDAPTPEKLQDVALLLARAVERGEKPTATRQAKPTGPILAMSPRIKALAEGLNDDLSNNRAVAAQSLGKLGEKAKAAGPALAERVADDFWGDKGGTARDDDYAPTNSKTKALEALLLIAPELAEDAVIRAAESKKADVILWGTARLGTLSDPPGRAKEDGLKPRLARLAANLKDDRSEVRRIAARSLGALGEKARPVAPALAERAADDVWGDKGGDSRDDDYTPTNSKTEAVTALRKVAPERVEVALIRATKSKNVEVRGWANARLAEDPTPDK